MNSASLPRLLLARTMDSARVGTRSTLVKRRGLKRQQPADPIRCQIEEGIEFFTAKSMPLGGPLHFNERTAAIHHHIHVGLGAGIFGVVEVQNRHPSAN